MWAFGETRPYSRLENGARSQSINIYLHTFVYLRLPTYTVKPEAGKTETYCQHLVGFRLQSDRLAVQLTVYK